MRFFHLSLLLLRFAPWADAAGADSIPLLGRDLVLDIKHEKIVPQCRREAGELVQSLLQELARKGYTIHLSREFIAADRDYYRVHATNESSPATARAVLACLEDSLRRAWLDWDCLRSASRAAPDSAVVMHHFPWLQIPRDPSEVRLAAATNSLPVIELTVRWEGGPVRGIAAFATPKINGVTVSDYRPTFSGEVHLWNPSASLRVRRGETTFFEQSYPAEVWKQQYVNNTDLPSYRTNQKILDDLHRELRPAVRSAPGAGPKKKRG